MKRVALSFLAMIGMIVIWITITDPSEPAPPTDQAPEHEAGVDLEHGSQARALTSSSKETSTSVADPKGDPSQSESSERVELTTTGSITFELVWASDLSIDLYELGELSIGLYKGGESASNDSCITRHRITLNDAGIAMIKDVPLGCAFKATLGSFLFDTVSGVGPTKAQRDLHVALTISSPPIIITGRVVDEHGMPLPGQKPQFSFMATGHGSITPVDSDSNGQFRIELLDFRAGESLRVSGRAFALESVPDMFRSREVIYKMASPWVLQPGKNELGELRFTPAMDFADRNLLLAGKVVMPDPEIQPKALRWRVEVRHGRAWTNLEVETRWPDLEKEMFEIRGQFEASKSHRLVFRGARQVPMDPMEFEPGSKQFRIEVPAAGKLKATILLDRLARDEHRSFRVSLERLNRAGTYEPRQGTRKRRFVTLDGLRFEWSNLRVGVYRLLVRAPGSQTPLVLIESIQVAGGENSDARLTDIDLQGTLRHVRFHIVDEAGKPVTQDTSLIIGGIEQGVRSKHDGHLSVSSAGQPTVFVMAKGYLLERCDELVDGQVVSLRKSPRVNFRVHFPFSLPPGCSPSLQLLAVDSGLPLRIAMDKLGYELPIANDGQVHMHLPYAGRWKLSIRLRPHASADVLVNPSECEVLGGSEEAIEITIDAMHLRTAIAELRRR